MHREEKAVETLEIDASHLCILALANKQQRGAHYARGSRGRGSYEKDQQHGLKKEQDGGGGGLLRWERLGRARARRTMNIVKGAASCWVAHDMRIE